MQRAVMIITFISGFFALLIFTFDTLNTASLTEATMYILLATGCLLLVLSFFRLFIEMTYEKDSGGIRRATVIMTILSFMIVIFGLALVAYDAIYGA
jgi:prolipoprotein diacylglyceryltransferase